MAAPRPGTCSPGSPGSATRTRVQVCLPGHAPATLAQNPIQDPEPRPGSRRTHERAAAEGLDGALLLAHLARGSAFLLLDGLDEVPTSVARDGGSAYPRALLLSGLADALPAWLAAGNRVLLISRPYGLDARGLAALGLPGAPILPLPTPLRDLFVARSGLLLPQAGHGAAFQHLSFQGFLAAERLACTLDRGPLTEVFRERGAVPEWRATLLFLFAAQTFGKRDDRWGLDLLWQLAADLDRECVRAEPAAAVLLAEALERWLGKGYSLPEPLAERVRRIALDAIEDEIPVRARHTLGLCLGRLGDPRIKDLRDPAAYVEVPAGDYVYGEKNECICIEIPFCWAGTR